MSQEQIIGLIGGYRWEEIPSKNPYMWSFQKFDDDKTYSRMNIYFTTWTVTIQDSKGKLETFKDVRTFENLETIISALV